MIADPRDQENLSFVGGILFMPTTSPSQGQRVQLPPQVHLQSPSPLATTPCSVGLTFLDKVHFGLQLSMFLMDPVLCLVLH